MPHTDRGSPLRDILGRVLHDYDLVVAKGNGGGAKPMIVGVLIGRSVYDLETRRSIRDLYLIEQPTPAELALKEQILQRREERAAAHAEQRAEAIPLRDMKAGGIYENAHGRCVFLGRCRFELYRDGEVTMRQEGLCYLPVSWRKYIQSADRVESILLHAIRTYRPALGFLKYNRTLRALVGQVALQPVYRALWGDPSLHGSKRAYRSTLYLLDLQPDETR